MSQPLRVAILTHSVNARGGVVHALELADALSRLGHHAVVHAPDPTGQGFFRTISAATVSIAARPAPRDIAGMVAARIADYIAHFETAAHRSFDVFHAQDSISGNALATLKQRGLIEGFVRTVHHIDDFDDRRLSDLQHRSIAAADRLITVSEFWRTRIEQKFGQAPVVVGNGVDIDRFTPERAPADTGLRARLGIGPALLCVGGVEERKNTLRIFEAFRRLRTQHPTAQLIIAGGATLLDHDRYRRAFWQQLEQADLPPEAVIMAGVLRDDEMPSLYRICDALIFASVREGFGLAVLEALASGCPVVASQIAPFTEYLSDRDVVWCDPLDAGSILSAMRSVLAAPTRDRLSSNGPLLARRHSWASVAERHLPVYRAMQEVQVA